MSSTNWDNFLELRDHPDAELHLQMLAREVRKCLDRTDDIQDLKTVEWLMPFVRQYDRRAAIRSLGLKASAAPRQMELHLLRKLSTACCTSTSYKTVDEIEMMMDRAIELHNKLVGSTPIQVSPPSTSPRPTNG